MHLKGKTALVTGAGRNLGRGIAIALAEDGADVVVNTRSNLREAEEVASEIRSHGVKASVVLADVSNAGDVRQMVQKALNEFGHLDILVNNVGIRAAHSFLEISEEEWNQVLAVNLTSMFHTAQAVLPAMKAQHFGRVINISAGAAYEGGPSHLAASKAGVLALTRTLAVEFSPHGITVNTVVPGFFNTSRLQPLAPDRLKQLIGRTLVGRGGEPEEIGALCAFLASERAGYITGQAIHINGGSYLH